MKSKSELYTEEREIILNKILEILNINEQNKLFSVCDLDKDNDKQTKILNLEVDIRKYFASRLWSCFAKHNIKRKVLSIIKNIMKEMNLNIISKRKQIKNKDTVYFDTIYYLL